uniref:Uncharacterized protein n=1 Tax=Tetranychus urticae TaxID=32264 RepID=T1JQZ4_TETUR
MEENQQQLNKKTRFTLLVTTLTWDFLNIPSIHSWLINPASFANFGHIQAWDRHCITWLWLT